MNRRHFLPLLFLLGIAGCGGRNTSDYYPKNERAKQALTIGLDAWKNGGAADPAGKLPSGTTVIAVDMDWSGGHKLSAYEIVNELPPDGPGPTKVSVKLTYADGQKVDATYFIVGIDPVRIFRDKDYEHNFGQLE
jgi:hypothetical protein